MAADPLSRVFSALADPTRRDIVARLAVGDARVTELAAPYDVTVQAVSKHLKVLEDAGLVSRSREAQRRPVHLEAQVFDLATRWIERYRRQAEERYRRLDDVLRAMPDDAARPDAADRDPPPPEEGTRHDRHHAPRGPDRGRPRRPADPDRPGVRRTAGHGLPRPHRPGARRAVDGAEQRADTGSTEWDCRTGGSWRYVPSTRARSTASTAASTRCGRTSCIVQTFTFEGMPDGVALEKLVLEDLGDGRSRLTATSLVDSFEGRDGFLASGMDVGVNEGYAKLDDLLARS